MISFYVNYDVEYDRADSLFDRIINERDNDISGHYALPYNHNTIQDCQSYASMINNKIANLKHIVIIGIGGSSLGLRAIDTMLYHLPHRLDIQLHFLEHIDPIETSRVLAKIDFSEALFIVISKSGLTIETTSLMKYCFDKFDLLHDRNKHHVLFITDEGSPLHALSIQHDIYSICIKANIGGRFSVLSSVGILPLMLLGYEVRDILYGAAYILDSFIARAQDHILHKAIFLAKNHNRYPINVLFSYSSIFRDFNRWYVQLWGESLGKLDSRANKIGLTPAALVGSIDQHSFLQLILEGKMDKTITMLSIKESGFDTHMQIPNLSFKGLESSDFVNSLSFAKLLTTQCLATQKVIQSEQIPLDSILLDSINERSIGALVMYYELLTSCIGLLFDINTYDQPAVERGKILLKNMLS